MKEINYYGATIDFKSIRVCVYIYIYIYIISFQEFFNLKNKKNKKNKKGSKTMSFMNPPIEMD